MEGCRRHCVCAAGAAVIGVAALLQAAPAQTIAPYPAAASRAHFKYIPVGGPTLAPIGWIRFCVSHKTDCKSGSGTRGVVALTPNAWFHMVNINDLVNRNIAPMTSMEHWGEVEHWAYPDDGKGDCISYVLLKRQRFLQAGWPREALLITVVRDKKGNGHAVLAVVTDEGEFVLDNEEPQILPWNKTGYHFIKQQSQSDPNVWFALDTARQIDTK